MAVLVTAAETTPHSFAHAPVGSASTQVSNLRSASQLVYVNEERMDAARHTHTPDAPYTRQGGVSPVTSGGRRGRPVEAADCLLSEAGAHLSLA